MYVTAILEFSVDPLTDPTPTWTAVTNVLLEAEWSGGIQTEGDDPTPGSARFLFHDNSRQFEPDYAAGAFYPNVVPGRRFRLRVTSSAVTYNEGIWFSQVFEPSWPDGATGQRSSVSCGDGMTILALDDLPGLDPPEAETYEDVVNFYEPWGYWRLGEAEGTRAQAIIRRRFRGKGKHRRKVKVRRGTRYTTREEAGGVSGPAGVYVGLPTLGERGAIMGDRDTSVHFAGGTERVNIPIENDDFRNLRGLTVMAWVNLDDDTGTAYVVAGPDDSLGQRIFDLPVVLGTATFRMRNNDGTHHTASGAALTPGVWAFVVGTWDGNAVRVYVDGVEGGLSDPQGHIRDGVSGSVHIWHASSSEDGMADEVAIIEHALTGEQIMGLYVAGTERGFSENPADARIRELADNLLWDASAIETGLGRDVVPVMMHGQSRMEEISETAHAEGPRTMFFFDGTGDPVYLGHEWPASHPSYFTPQATFGNSSGEVPFENVELVSDDETYTTVVASHESGESVEVSTGETPARVNTEWTDVMLMEHNHVESLAGHVLDFYKDAQFRPYRLELSGVDTSARAQILIRQIGDCIRVKHRPRGTGAIIDRVCNIIGYEKRLDAETGHLSCTWYLSRGFNAGQAVWRAGVTGFSEAGTTTIAG